MKNRLPATALAAALLAFPAASMATNGYFSHGYGIKSKGMGGVGIALPQDTLAAASNPAGMVEVGSRLDVGVDWFHPTRGSEIRGNAYPDANYDGNDKQDFFIPEFGYNKMLDERTSLGITAYGNGGMNSDYKVNSFERFGATGSSGVNLEQLFIAPTLAYKLTPSHSVGVSLNFAYQRFSAKGLGPFAMSGPGQASASPGNVTNNGTDSATGWGVRIGWLGQLTPDLAVGATYQSKTSMTKLDKYQGLFAEQGGMDIPENYGVGVAFKATPQLTVAADVVRINYSSIKSIGSGIANMTVLGNPLGAANGPGFGWTDMTVVKLGASYQFNANLTLRAGYNHGKQPIPSSETFLNILAPGVVEDHVTFGATWALDKQSEVSLSYLHAFKNTVSGSATAIPASFGGGTANLYMSQDALGIAYGRKM
ncbi:MAG: outer membrane protein transport protein [Sulfuricella sp.]|nr:outer membrane protein transport protein [Sulfuricella sp.]